MAGLPDQLVVAAESGWARYDGEVTAYARFET